MGVFGSTMAGSRSADARKTVGYYFKRLGTSVLFSGAAVGVSHVVQSTRAGADFSLGLIPVILACLALKYPAFLFGPLYTNVSGESVVMGYSRLGKWTLPLVAVVFISVMFTVVAAVSLLASGILIATLGMSFNVTYVSTSMIVLCTGLSLFASFVKFQDSMKVVFLLLVGMSFLILGLAVPKLEASNFAMSFNLTSLTGSQIYFIAALIGWMPAGLDLPMMHSQWLLASKSDSGKRSDAIEDFNFGYISTSVLALVFVLIGAVFFYGSGIVIEESAIGFTKQLLSIYASSLGSLAGLLMGVTLFLAIFSTLYVVVDGFPRVLAEVFVRIWPASARSAPSNETFRAFSAWLQAGGAFLLLLYFTTSLRALVDFATIVSFIVGPVFAVLNHRLTSLPQFTDNGTVPGSLRLWSFVGIAFFTVFTIYYVALELL